MLRAAQSTPGCDGRQTSASSFDGRSCRVVRLQPVDDDEQRILDRGARLRPGNAAPDQNGASLRALERVRDLRSVAPDL